MAEEEWDFVDGLKKTRTALVCMTCQHFSYVSDRHCHTLLTCGLQRRQVPMGSTSPRSAATGLCGVRWNWVGVLRGRMQEGWLIDADDNWIWRFWRDETEWVRDPKGFLDRGRPARWIPIAEGAIGNRSVFCTSQAIRRQGVHISSCCGKSWR